MSRHDFQFDQTTDGRTLKFLNLIDEYSRLCLANQVGRRCRAAEVNDTIEQLVKIYPPPTHLWKDNGQELNYFAEALRVRQCLAGMVHSEWLQHGYHPNGLTLGEPGGAVIQQTVRVGIPQHRAVHRGAGGQAVA